MRARTETRLPLVLLALCLLLAACGREAPAPAAPEATAAPSLSPLPHRMHAEGESLRVYVDGLLAARGWTEDGCVYVPLRAVSGLLGLEQSWSGEEESFELRVGGLQVRGERDKEYFSAGGRYLWAPEGWRIREGELCLPWGRSASSSPSKPPGRRTEASRFRPSTRRCSRPGRTGMS